MAVLIATGVVCFTAIEQPVSIALLAGFGTFCLVLGTALGIWALVRNA
jgi:hypothetical protein